MSNVSSFVKPTDKGLPLPSESIDLHSPLFSELEELVSDVEVLPTKYRRKNSLAGQYDDTVSWVQGVNPLFWIKAIVEHHQERTLRDVGGELKTWLQLYMGLFIRQDGQIDVTIPYSLWTSPQKERHVFQLIEWLSEIGLADTIREINARTDQVQAMYGFTNNTTRPHSRRLTSPLLGQSLTARIDQHVDNGITSTLGFTSPAQQSSSSSSHQPMPASDPAVPVDHAGPSSSQPVTLGHVPSPTHAPDPGLDRQGGDEDFVGDDGYQLDHDLPPDTAHDGEVDLGEDLAGPAGLALETPREAAGTSPLLSGPAHPLPPAFDFHDDHIPASSGDDAYFGSDHTLNGQQSAPDQTAPSIPAPPPSTSSVGFQGDPARQEQARDGFWSALERAVLLTGVPVPQLNVNDGLGKRPRAVGREGTATTIGSAAGEPSREPAEPVTIRAEFTDIHALRSLHSFCAQDSPVRSSRPLRPVEAVKLEEEDVSG